MREVGVIMAAWEYRVKRYGEDEKTAKDRARGLGENVVEHRTHSQPSANIGSMRFSVGEAYATTASLPGE